MAKRVSNTTKPINPFKATKSPKESKPSKNAFKERWGQPWDKSSIATLIGSIGTIAALLFSVYQNNISDRRYFENDSSSKREQQRVSQRDSAQITTLVNSFTVQLTEYGRQRKRDSINIKLYQEQLANLNQSLGLQNELLNIERLTNKSDLLFKAKFRPCIITDEIATIVPEFLIENRGKSPAELIGVKYLMISVDTWRGIREVKCNSPVTEYFHFQTLNPGDTTKYTVLQERFYKFLPDDSRTLEKKQIIDECEKFVLNNRAYSMMQRKLDSIYKAYNGYEFFMITKLIYRDKFESKVAEINHFYSINLLGTPPDYAVYTKKNPQVVFSLQPVEREVLMKYRSCIIDNKFNYDQLTNEIKHDEGGMTYRIFD